MEKIKNYAFYFLKYMIYLVKLAFSKIRDFIRMRFPKFYIRLITINPKFLALGIIAIIVGIVGGIQIYPKVATYLSTPRPPKITQAPGGSGFQFQAADGRNSVITLIGEAEGNVPKIQASFEKGAKVDFVLSEISNNIPKPKQEANKLTFNNVRDGVDVQYETVVDGVKESLILNKPVDGNKFVFNISAEGAKPESIGTNLYSNYFTDSEGNFLFAFVKPFAVDANGARTDHLVLTISRDEIENTYQASVDVNEEWLNSPDRAYPINIDPTITYNAAYLGTYGQHNRTAYTYTFDPYPAVNRLHNQELTSDQYTVGLWHMNEATGTTTVADSSGNGNTITSSSSSNVTDGQLGNARSFSGGSYAQSANNINITGSAPRTIEFWAKVNNTTNQGLVGWGTPANASWSAAIIYNGHWYFNGYASPGDVDWDTGITPDTQFWHHHAITYDGSRVEWYVDGVSIGSKTLGIPLTTTASPLNVGRRPGSADLPLSGNVDEIRVSKGVRSAEEIRMSAQKRPYGIFTSDLLSASTTAWNSLSFTPFGEPTGDGETAPTNSLVAQWNFNNTSGTTATNDADASSCGGTPSNCNFTLNNFASTGSQDATTNSGWTAANKRWGAGALMLSSAATADNLSLADPPSDLLDIGFTNLTIEAWIKTTSSNVEIFSNNNNNGTACTNDGYRLGIDASGYPTYHADRNGATAGCIDSFTHFIKVNDGQWHYIVASNGYQGGFGSTHTLFVDGIPHRLESLVYPDYPAATTTGNVYIGGASGGFDGIIDSVRFYSRGLTKSEILGNYNIGNIELQTRVGNTTNPDDGTWEEWRPTTSEAQIQSLDADQANWAWDLVATYMPKSQANDSNIKVEGSGSLKLTTGAPQVDANTVGLWHLDETGGSGAFFKDASPNGNNASIAAGGPVVVNGVAGKARRFNGSTDYLQASLYSPALGASNITIEAWVHLGSTSLQGTFVKDQNSSVGIGVGNTQFTNAGNNLILLYEGVRWINTGVQIGTGWHHVAAVIDANGKPSAYIDGVKVYTDSSTAPTPVSNANILIGGGQASRYFNGNIDEVRLSNIARSGEEIAEAYRMGRDHRFTRTIASTDLSSTQKLAFNVAADRPGTYLEALIGNNAYANYEPDANTVGLWHLDDAAVTSPKATGGTITYSGTDIIHTFTSSGTITPSKATNAQILVVGGGGGGGCNGGGGGGAGGVVYYNSVSFAAQPYTITVGNGGPATCNSVPANGTGQNTVIGAITAYGGGGGASRDAGGAAASGGSGGGGGGGAAPQITAGSGTAGQGSAGGGGYNQGCDSAGGGGGGAGAVGAAGGWNTGGNGGVGVSNSISGVATYYGGGGGGGTTGYPGCNANNSWTQGTGGTGGGGTGETSAGTANTGGGGGAERAGGSGIVITRYNGANLRDASGNNNDGALNGTTLTQGAMGKARSFNGTSDQLVLTSTPTTGTGSFTIDAWIKTSTTGTTKRIISYGTSGTTNAGLGFHINASNQVQLVLTNVAGPSSTITVTDGKWHHVAAVNNAGTVQIYVDGMASGSSMAMTPNILSSTTNRIGADVGGTASWFNGLIDEVRVSNTARTPAEIRAAYEYSRRAHEVTIDFGAKLDSGNLITGSGDTSFTVDATYYGLPNKGSAIYPGDKIIVRENYDGTTYITQGTVSGVTPSTGAVSVLSWDVNSFPSGGYTANADVFKWQREYFDVMGSLSTQRNAITKLTLHETNGNEGRSIWVDNIGSVGPYLSDPAGSTITSSTGSQYFQYRAILSTNNYNLGTGITGASINFASNAPNQPVMISGNPVTTTTVKWNFTNTGGGVGGITGFKLFDQNNNEIPSANISDCYTTPAATYCTETGITPNTTITRKIAAYNAYGLSPYSLYSTVTTLAAVPPEPTLSSPTATSLVLTQGAGTNPASTEIAIYQKAGTDCNISGGYFLKADGTSNGGTPVWLTSSAWGNVPISGLDLDNNQYIFCASARNTAGISTAYAGNATGGGYFRDVAEYTMIGNMSFASSKRFIDGSNGARKTVGLDYGSSGWWKFDEANGNALDSSGNGLTGTPTGTSIVAGKYGNARTFTAANSDVVKIGDVLDMGLDNFTTSAWIKTSSANNGMLVSKAWESPYYGMTYTGFGGGFINCDLNNGTGTKTVQSSTTVGDDTWHHVACVFNRSGNMEVFIDGVSRGTTSISSDSAVDITNSSYLSIGGNCSPGGSSCGNYFQGQLDNVLIYNARLSQHQIAQDMNSTNPQNISKFRAQSGTLTLMSDETMSVGELILSGGSVAIPTGTQMKIGSPIWHSVADSDNDGYLLGDPTTAYYGDPPINGKRRFLLPVITGTDCDDTNASIHINTPGTGGTTATIDLDGNITYSGGYTIQTFTGNGTFRPNFTGNVEVLVVAGGGAGGAVTVNYWETGGGGGGGGVVYSASSAVTKGTVYPVTVGLGGKAATGTIGTNGENSSFNSITATGGGRGGGMYNHGASGGSGGGGGGGFPNPGSGTGGQGNAGGYGQNIATTTQGGGGGGGAGGVGGNGSSAVGGNGGAGIANSITGSSVYYGGGGGGSGTSGGTGGIGGGGTRGNPGGSGTANTGGGGGSGSNPGTTTGGNGGSGVVIIRYPTITEDLQYTAHTYTTPGTYSFTPNNSGNVEVMVVAGGGAGGAAPNGYWEGGGGGGAGGLIYNTAYAVTSGQPTTVTVGNGGTAASATAGTSGGNSVFGSITAIGGGRGAGGYNYAYTGGSGGGGGGGGVYYPGQAGTAGQGNAGGNGTTDWNESNGSGGGGGKKAAGSNSSTNRGGNGGDGIGYWISGTYSYYAGGGAGWGRGGAASGGIGGGGTSPSGSGTANTGGGGAAASNIGTNTGGGGGSGIVIVRYPYCH
jgi:hypothetical protein